MLEKMFEGELDAYLGYFQPLLCALDCIYWKEHAGPQLLCGWGFVGDKRALLWLNSHSLDL